MTITDQLAAIEARAQAATEGPWEFAYYGSGGGLPEGCEVTNGKGALDLGTSKADAEFIAHARTDVPALLAMVREQQARLDKAAVLDAAEEDRRIRQEGSPRALLAYATVDVDDLRVALTATEGA
jgi:hypothetical protein